ncbi:(2Fe-2S)-binding protein [Pseudonocardia dioxanivorans]|uniref:(2Fe-2S)-binding protein n=1 Tax=Pseudonocardia dioxanivorans TaxID=240495 RepID=UPI000CD05743|nr:(2Fe-2S)-binding protein [Pseudonocardia dioxanivorans]
MTTDESAKTYPVDFVLNGRRTRVDVDPRTLLADVIRHEAGLTGVKIACEQGVCGSCTVLENGLPIRSCITLAVQVAGAEIETVEAIAPSGADLHPIQESFQREHGLQCGFCTPGMVLTTKALLAENPDPDEQEIREYLSGNICRCTGYVGIVASVREAARCARAASPTGATTDSEGS